MSAAYIQMNFRLILSQKQMQAVWSGSIYVEPSKWGSVFLYTQNMLNLKGKIITIFCWK